ncbi:hypothetical protein GCM10008919_16270 [Selenomonas dianae]|uniref:Uncharacterized protein n=1 Tax=Selenomonas dianae TaxID=135079 RepID=A0ABN0T6K6_9FIRM
MFYRFFIKWEELIRKSIESLAMLHGCAGYDRIGRSYVYGIADQTDPQTGADFSFVREDKPDA